MLAHPNGQVIPQAAKPDDEPTDGIAATAQKGKKSYKWGAPEADYDTYKKAKEAICAQNYSAMRTSGNGVARQYVFGCKLHEQCSDGNGAQMRIVQVLQAEVRLSRWKHLWTRTGICHALY